MTGWRTRAIERFAALSAVVQVSLSPAYALANAGGPTDASVVTALCVTGAFLIQYEIIMSALYYAICWITDVDPHHARPGEVETDAPPWLLGAITGISEFLVFSIAIATGISGVMIAMITWTLIKVHLHWNIFSPTQPVADEKTGILIMPGVRRKYVALLTGIASLFIAMLVGLYARLGWPGASHIFWVSVVSLAISGALLGIARMVKWRRHRVARSTAPAAAT